MKLSILLFISTALITTAIVIPVSAHPQVSHSVHYAKFKGAWFTIEYPAGWTVKPSLMESANESGSTQSVFFRSPDGGIEFYVFSPQWNGDPKDILLNPQRETLIFHHVERASRGKMTGGGYISNTVANWYTVRAKDHSYERSWVDVEDKGLNVRHVFGIKYRNRQVYQKYQAQYAHFRGSLQGFSD